MYFINQIKSLVAGLMFLASVNAFASLSVHPTKLTETVGIGENKTIILHITNLGPSGSLGYQVSSSASWLTLDPALGSLNVNDTVGVKLIIDGSALQQGINKAEITVGDPHHGPVVIPIEINVTAISDFNEQPDINGIFLKTSPNPVNFETEISYYLPSQQNTEISLYGVNGKLIKTLFNGSQTEGLHKMLHHVTEFPAGYYYMALRVPFTTIVSPLIINK